MNIKNEIQRRKVAPRLPLACPSPLLEARSPTLPLAPRAPRAKPGAATPHRRPFLLRQDDAGAEAVADARQACEALEAVARQAKAERSRADAIQRRETEALLAFEALVSVPPGHAQALKAAIAAAQPHAKAMPDLFGQELAAARDQLAALECADAADRREMQGLPPARGSAPTRASNMAAAPPTSGRDAARRRAESEEREARRRAEQASREEVRQHSSSSVALALAPSSIAHLHARPHLRPLPRLWPLP